MERGKEVKNMKHELKIHPAHFNDVISGAKPFEVRKNDRDYKVGDNIVLNEYNPETQKYTGEWALYEITIVFSESEYVKDGYVILGIVQVFTCDEYR
jgi:hypothetical protein